ncbi:sesquipedalian-1 [Astyanax mexicanus]|uniref:Sesquipedalian n=2 Tax=Astyanax mexicanus TaxID=7994 RepID=A0A8B9LXM7_ASTMX|nr:sesquipedalian-1 [Astyanax mexicanus]KAG9264025.1 sesquipedalian-1-like [Astyanax mexicanus]
MKIHKKILTHYLSCTSPVDKEGYLYKKRERNTSYLRRWFVLKGNLLFYQERPADRSLLGVIVLEGCVVQAGDPDGLFSFSLVFTGPGLRTYRLAAEDHLTQESWISALLTASHIYISLLVKDLERLYKEAKQEKSLAGSSPSSVTGSCVRASSTAMAFNTGPPFFFQRPPALPREKRSYSASSALQSPAVHTPVRTTNKRSPKLWPKRNAHVTPLNGPAPPHGEWPLMCFDPLEEFSKLHEYYGNEVKQLRADWLKSKRLEEGHVEEDLIDLG